MTIASEITRLQNDKAAICTAIENKGVTVGNVTLDDYASCIDAIEQGGGAGGKFVDVLVVAGGGGGGGGNTSSGSYGGGGGAGGLKLCYHYQISDLETISIGDGGGSNTDGCNSNFGTLTTKGGGAGGLGNCSQSLATSWGHDGGSGGGGGSSATPGCSAPGMAIGTLSYGSAGQQGYQYRAGGGGGAGGLGYPANLGQGGPGIFSDISGTMCEYAPGGTSGGYAASCYGGGGGGRCGSGCKGCQGIVIVRYKTDGSCGIECATGGSKYTCGEYTIHCFTSNGNFEINPSQQRFKYLVVGGGGNGSRRSGGGGGEVKCGGLSSPASSMSVVVGGVSGTSCLGDLIIAKGGCTANVTQGGTSGTGNTGSWGNWKPGCCGGGGGGGSTGIGYAPKGTYAGGDGGEGFCGYGGGGGGARTNCTIYCQGCGKDGGGDGALYTGGAATNCGGGGGGGYCTGGGAGACGVVDICYACDGSDGISSATGGNSCYVCDGYCVHRFTSNGTFTIVS